MEEAEDFGFEQILKDDVEEDEERVVENASMPPLTQSLFESELTQSETQFVPTLEPIMAPETEELQAAEEEPGEGRRSGKKRRRLRKSRDEDVDFDMEAAEAQEDPTLDEEELEGDDGGDGHRRESKKKRKKKRRKHREKRTGKDQSRRQSTEARVDPEDSDDVIRVTGGIDSDKDYMSEGPDEHPPESRQKQRRRNNYTVSPEEAMSRAQSVIHKMYAAADADDNAIRVGEPALAKLQLADEITLEIAKPKWVNWYLQEDVTSALARWLTTVSERQLPNLTIRSKVLILLEKLPLTTEHLQRNELGRRLVALWKSPSEIPENRLIIRGLVQQLVRPLLGLRWSPRAGREEDAQPNASIPREIQQSPANHLTVRNRHVPRLRARVPVTPGHHFKVMPRSTYDPDAADVAKDPSSAVGRLSRLMDGKSRKGTFKNARPQHVMSKLTE